MGASLRGPPLFHPLSLSGRVVALALAMISWVSWPWLVAEDRMISGVGCIDLGPMHKHMDMKGVLLGQLIFS